MRKALHFGITVTYGKEPQRHNTEATVGAVYDRAVIDRAYSCLCVFVYLWFGHLQHSDT